MMLKGKDNMRVIILQEQIIRKTDKAAFIRFINEEPQYQNLCLCLPLQYLEKSEDKRVIVSIPKNALILPLNSLKGKYLQQALTPGKYKGLFEDEEQAFLELKQVVNKDNLVEITFPLDKPKYQYFKLITESENIKEISLENAEGESEKAYEFNVNNSYQVAITLNNDDTKLARLLSTVEPLEEEQKSTWKKVK